jgi:hypothetical protein
MRTFLQRYRTGEREQVWAELQSLGEKILEPGTRDDAWAVACETMRRARANVETLYGRLKTQGYEFEKPDWAWVPALPSDVEVVRQIESLVGPMPLSLRAWYEIVGSVWWTGRHPAWSSFGPETDALVITPVGCILDECEVWLEDREQRYEEYRRYFHVEISPDRLHKANISGGPPYAIACGPPCADGLVKEENRRVSFVPYLRACFRHGGFVGFEGYAAEDNDLLKLLTEGLLEI